MSSLGSRYARYGLMASMVLIALDALERRGGDPDEQIIPYGDDAARIDRLRELLAASYLGGVSPAERETHKLTTTTHKTAHSSVDESTIVKSVLGREATIKDFVPKADLMLDHLTKDGITRLDEEDRLFFNDEFKPFLRRLADSHQIVVTSRRPSGRQRHSLL